MEKAEKGDRDCVWEGCNFRAKWASREAFQAEGTRAMTLRWHRLGALKAARRWVWSE